MSPEATGQLDEAVDSYRHAVNLNRDQKPKSLAAAEPRLSLTKLDRLKRRRRFCGSPSITARTWPKAHYRLGVNLHRQGNDDSAIAELEQAATLDPTSTEALYVLGQVYRGRGDTKAAGEAFDKYRAFKKEQRGPRPPV